MYYSSYSAAYLGNLVRKITAIRRTPVWCIFDNTARGAAVLNAIDLRAKVTAR